MVGVRDHHIVKNTLAKRCAARGENRLYREIHFYLSIQPVLSPSSALLLGAKKHSKTHHLHLEHKTPRLFEISRNRRVSQLDRSNRFFELDRAEPDFFLALSHSEMIDAGEILVL